MSGLTDNELVSAMARAGIPKVYRAKEASLRGYENEEELRQWVKGVASDPAHAVDARKHSRFLAGNASEEAWYLTARALVLHGVSVKLYQVPDLFHHVELYNIAEHTEARVVGVLGLTAGGLRVPGPEERYYAVQKWFRNVLAEDCTLLLQGYTDMASERQWWDADFREFISGIRCIWVRKGKQRV